MTSPGFSAEMTLGRRPPLHTPRREVRAAAADDEIIPQSCSFWEWMACAGTVAGCAASCIYKGSECFECFARAGREVCFNCV